MPKSWAKMEFVLALKTTRKVKKIKDFKLKLSGKEEKLSVKHEEKTRGENTRGDGGTYPKRNAMKFHKNLDPISLQGPRVRLKMKENFEVGI